MTVAVAISLFFVVVALIGALSAAIFVLAIKGQ